MGYIVKCTNKLESSNHKTKTLNKMKTKKEKKFVIETLKGDVEVTGVEMQAIGTHRVQIIGLNDEVIAVVPPNRLIYELPEDSK